METGMKVVISLLMIVCVLFAFVGGLVYGRYLGEKIGYATGETVGYNRGLAEGKETGYKTGLNEGKRLGFVEGKKVGEDEGYNRGKSESEAKNYNRGYADGFYDGERKGYERGKNEALREFLANYSQFNWARLWNCWHRWYLTYKRADWPAPPQCEMFPFHGFSGDCGCSN